MMTRNNCDRVKVELACKAWRDYSTHFTSSSVNTLARLVDTFSHVELVNTRERGLGIGFILVALAENWELARPFRNQDGSPR
jgi:hypothetical protein